MTNRKWIEIHECDDEEDNVTVWATEYICSGKTAYVWILMIDSNDYIVDIDCNGFAYHGKHYKTLTGAKKLAESFVRKMEDE